eukprot:g4060.t1
MALSGWDDDEEQAVLGLDPEEARQKLRVRETQHIPETHELVAMPPGSRPSTAGGGGGGGSKGKSKNKSVSDAAVSFRERRARSRFREKEKQRDEAYQRSMMGSAFTKQEKQIIDERWAEAGGRQAGYITMDKLCQIVSSLGAVGVSRVMIEELLRDIGYTLLRDAVDEIVYLDIMRNLKFSEHNGGRSRSFLNAKAEHARQVRIRKEQKLREQQERQRALLRQSEEAHARRLEEKRQRDELEKQKLLARVQKARAKLSETIQEQDSERKERYHRVQLEMDKRDVAMHERRLQQSQDIHRASQLRREELHTQMLQKRVARESRMMRHEAQIKERVAALEKQRTSRARHAEVVKKFTAKELEILIALFNDSDIDGNGKISEVELVGIFERLGQNLSTETATSLIEDATTTTGGELSLTDFLALTITLKTTGIKGVRSDFLSEKSKAIELAESRRRLNAEAKRLDAEKRRQNLEQQRKLAAIRAEVSREAERQERRRRAHLAEERRAQRIRELHVMRDRELQEKREQLMVKAQRTAIAHASKKASERERLFEKKKSSTRQLVARREVAAAQKAEEKHERTSKILAQSQRKADIARIQRKFTLKELQAMRDAFGTAKQNSLQDALSKLSPDIDHDPEDEAIVDWKGFLEAVLAIRKEGKAPLVHIKSKSEQVKARRQALWAARKAESAARREKQEESAARAKAIFESYRAEASTSILAKKWERQRRQKAAAAKRVKLEEAESSRKAERAGLLPADMWVRVRPQTPSCLEQEANVDMMNQTNQTTSIVG